ncbi:MAG: bacterial Ig-like domain-containing protein [Clostridia bacterium]|nr:bacterial Ig-like domain-containing protein [Clostridia bacterium]
MKANSAFSKILLIILVFSMVLSAASCTLIGGSLKLESFTVDRSSVKTVYVVGEPIDFSGIKATAVYSDETLSKVYTYDELTISYEIGITDTPGQKTVTVSFDDPHLNTTQRTTVQITVNEDPNAVKHVSYRIDASAVKTAYVVGETVDFSGIKVYEKFSDNTEVEITDLTKLTYTPSLDGLTASAGNTAVKVQYNGEDAGSVTVKVSDPEVEKNDVVSVVVGGEFKTEYEVGETLDLTGITVTLTYEDGQTVVLEAEDITAEEIDMTEAGSRTVVISFTDPINNEVDYESVTITLIKKDVVEQFEKPAGITAFESDNKSAGTLQYGAAGFQGQFIEGGKLYVVGDDNEWEFLPAFAVDKDGIPTTQVNFYTTVDLYVKVDGEYVLLDKTQDTENATLYTYTNSDGEALAVVDTYRGSYTFAEAAVGEQLKLSVLPSDEYYKIEGVNALTFEFKVIDGYNVYEAWQLAVIDNDSTRTDWVQLKTEKGILNYNPAAVVIHADIHIGADDVPASFFYVTETETTYKDETDPDNVKTSVAPVGTRYLIDGTEIYVHSGSSELAIEGNFFRIDTQNFPLVPSKAVFGSESDWDYGSDFSNATLFVFKTNDRRYDPKPEDVSNVTVANLDVAGNAARNNWVDAEGNLASAGGLILVKVKEYSTATFTNMIGNSFFLGYFPDQDSIVTIDKVKCYDSYQNAVMVWGNVQATISDSYLSGAGGPLIICQSSEEDSVWYNPTLTVTNTVNETHLSGEEIWFTAVNATTIVGEIKALGGGINTVLNSVGAAGNWVDGDGKMNIVGLLMASGTDASKIIGGVDAQGEMTFDTDGIARWQNDPTYWGIIYNHPAFAANAPFITVFGADGTPYTLYFNGTIFCDIMGNVIGNDASHQAIIAAFATAEYVTLSQGGLSVVFEFYH